jgi:hypothetical protein
LRGYGRDRQPHVTDATANPHAVGVTSRATMVSAVTEPSTSTVAASVSGELLGRDYERQQLHGLIRRATEGWGGLALLAGEPGIGKSSLAGDALSAASAAGMATVWATCWQGPGTPAYWPWVQVLRHLRRALPIEQVHAAFADVAADLGPLAQEVAPQATGGGEADRFRVFDAVTQGLLELGRRSPLFVVLDDLHWADAPSLELLDFAAQQSAAASIVFVGTYRDVELAADHPLRALVGRSASNVVHLQLGGLAPARRRPGSSIGSPLTRAGTPSSCASWAGSSPVARHPTLPTSRTTCARWSAIECSECPSRPPRR